METNTIDLLREIILNPDDDALRLIYADKIEEDDPKNADRAEFIRLQVERSRLEDQECKYDCRSRIDYRCKWCNSIDKGDGLLGRNQQWCPWTWDDNQRTPLPVFWSRGFIESISVPADVWIANHYKIAWNEGQATWCPTCAGKCGHIMGTSDQYRSPANCMTEGEFKRDAGKGWRSLKPHPTWKRCEQCDGGSVPRPLPKTAHPIRKVEITTSPAINHENARDGRERAWSSWGILKEWLDPRPYPNGGYFPPDRVFAVLQQGCEYWWPRIEFTFRERPWETERHWVNVNFGTGGRTDWVEAGEAILVGHQIAADSQGRAVRVRVGDYIVGHAISNSQTR